MSSKNLDIIDIKPKMVEIPQPLDSEQFYTMTIKAGQWMGFLLFTYPAQLTVSSSKAP